LSNLDLTRTYLCRESGSASGVGQGHLRPCGSRFPGLSSEAACARASAVRHAAARHGESDLPPYAPRARGKSFLVLSANHERVHLVSSRPTLLRSWLNGLWLLRVFQ